MKKRLANSFKCIICLIRRNNNDKAVPILFNSRKAIMSDDNISAFLPKRQDKITVGIEDVDESWALKLLNECEAEDTFITVDSESKDGDYESLSLLDQDDPVIKVLDERARKIELMLTAIECQKMAFAEKQQARLLEEQTRKGKLTASFSKIKAFFVA